MEQISYQGLVSSYLELLCAHHDNNLFCCYKCKSMLLWSRSRKTSWEMVFSKRVSFTQPIYGARLPSCIPETKYFRSSIHANSRALYISTKYLFILWLPYWTIFIKPLDHSTECQLFLRFGYLKSWFQYFSSLFGHWSFLIWRQLKLLHLLRWRSSCFLRHQYHCLVGSTPNRYFQHLKFLNWRCCLRSGCCRTYAAW